MRANVPVASPDRTVEVDFYDPGGPGAVAAAARRRSSGRSRTSVGVYVIDATFPSAGDWTAPSSRPVAAGSPTQTITFSFDVQPRVERRRGRASRASVDTPTLADVGGDVAKISTDATPVTAFYETSVADALAAQQAVRARLRDAEVLPDATSAARRSTGQADRRRSIPA